MQRLFGSYAIHRQFIRIAEIERRQNAQYKDIHERIFNFVNPSNINRKIWILLDREYSHSDLVLKFYSDLYRSELSLR